MMTRAQKELLHLRFRLGSYHAVSAYCQRQIAKALTNRSNEDE